MNYGTGWLTRPLMFLSSYAPLLLILAIRFEDWWLRSVTVAIAALGIAGVLVLMRLQHEEPDVQGRTKLIEVRQAGAGASSYLAGYLLPFVTISQPNTTDLLAYAGFFIVAYFVTARTGIIQVNPTLFILGYRVDSITDKHGARRFLLSRTKDTITAGTTIQTSRMTNDVLLFEKVIENSEQ